MFKNEEEFQKILEKLRYMNEDEFVELVKSLQEEPKKEKQDE